MAKDVDLSSKEWRDLVFEGKNKEYGAYVMRSNSVKRHNRAMLVIILILAVVAILGIVVNTVIAAAEARPEDENEQALVEMATEAEEEEEEMEEEQQKYEEPEPEVIKEDLLNTVKLTEIAIMEDDKVTEQIKNQDELKEDDTAVGAVNEDRGVDNIIDAQEHKNVVVVEEVKPEPPKVEKPDDNKVFTSVEQMPVYPGGEGALLADIHKNLVYPPVAAENGVEGKVTVSFVVTKNGSIGEVKVARGKDPDLDKEAQRAVRALKKKFTPGKMNGHAVNVWYHVPITFRLNK
jgi:protein TonB